MGMIPKAERICEVDRLEDGAEEGDGWVGWMRMLGNCSCLGLGRVWRGGGGKGKACKMNTLNVF